MIADLLLVSDVPRTEADEFVARYRADGVLTTASFVVSVGIFREGSLIGLIQISAPTTKVERELYTTKISRIVLASDDQDAEYLVSMIRFYIEKYKPSDLFIELNELNGSRDPLFVAQYLIDELDWRVERGDGKVVAEWFASNRTFYTYKISASDSDKYYFGVSHIKLDEASADDCLLDGYWGSGGSKFRNWKSKHADLLEKEIISLHKTRAAAYNEEKKLVGNKWREDDLCLNSMPGGVSRPPSKGVTDFSLKDCQVHGPVIHRGPTCGKCISESTGSIMECPTHGSVYHHGGSCRKCSRAKGLKERTCETHGKVLFTGEQCLTCMNLKSISKKECYQHGVSTFQGDTCMICMAEAKTNMAVCEAHGRTKHYGTACCKCSGAKRVAEDICDIHGAVIFLDGKCARCTNLARVHLRNCEIHGETKHQGNKCSKCTSQQNIAVKNCDTHGEAKHFGDSCASCLAENAVSEKECPVHGVTKHQGDKCSRCVNGSLVSLKMCSVHGETKHRGLSCYKCFSEKNRAVLKDCPIHGEAKHQGNSCAKCRIEKRTHNSKHKEEANEDCQFC